MGNFNCKLAGHKYASIDKKKTVETEATATLMSFTTRIPKSWSLRSLKRHVDSTTTHRDSTTTVDSGTQGSIMSGDQQYNCHRNPSSSPTSLAAAAAGATIPSSRCGPFLKQLRETPYSFRGDYEQMMTRIIRHRSEFPLQIWEAIIVAARAPGTNPVKFYWEVYEAVQTMILVGIGDDERHSDGALEEVEVALRVFPNILREYQQLHPEQQQHQQGQRKRERRFRMPFRGNKSRPFDSLLIELEEEFGIRPETEDETDVIEEEEEEEEKVVEKSALMSCNTSTHGATATSPDENNDDTEKTCSMRTASTLTSTLVSSDAFVNKCATANRSKLSLILQELLQEPGDDLTALTHLQERGLLRRKCVGDCIEVALYQQPSSWTDRRFRFLLACYPEILKNRKLFRKFLLHCYNCNGEDCRANDGQWLRLKSLFEIGLWHFPNEMGFVVEGNRVVKFVGFKPYLQVSCFLFGRTNVTRLVRRILWKFSGGFGCNGLQSMLVVRTGMVRKRRNAAFHLEQRVCAAQRILESSHGRAGPVGESSQRIGIGRCTNQDWGRE